MPEKLLITNCKLFNAADNKQTTSILIENGTITQIGPAESPGHCDNILDAQGRVITPGFIDVHIQGAGGYDILDATEEALKQISKTCARFGVTGFLATTVFKPNKPNRHLSVAAEYAHKNLGGAELLGIHLEGPFISQEKKGMIHPDCICLPSPQIVDEIMALTGRHLKMMTIAPELPNCLQTIRTLTDSGIIASFAHSSADYEQTLAGFDAGISHVTHLFNAMVPIHHRCPGPLVAIFQSEHITVQLIPDGVHMHPSILKFAFDTLGPDRSILITDAMQAMGLPDGKYIYNGFDYESKLGTARYKDGTLIGTALGLSLLVKRFMTFTNCPIDIAVKTVTENPAKLLGLADKKGSIAIGKDADLVLLEPDNTVHTTIVGGKIIYEK